MAIILLCKYCNPPQSKAGKKSAVTIASLAIVVARNKTMDRKISKRRSRRECCRGRTRYKRTVMEASCPIVAIPKTVTTLPHHSPIEERRNRTVEPKFNSVSTTNRRSYDAWRLHHVLFLPSYEYNIDCASHLFRK
jgi:hypothetical protein